MVRNRGGVLRLWAAFFIELPKISAALLNDPILQLSSATSFVDSTSVVGPCRALKSEFD